MLDELDDAEAQSLEEAAANWINGNRSDVLGTLADLEPIDAAGMALAIFARLGEMEPDRNIAEDFAAAVLRRGSDGS